MNTDLNNNINKLLLKQYSEVLSSEMKQNDKYDEFNKKFKQLGKLTTIEAAEQLFFNIFNKTAENGSFMQNECLITVERKTDTMRICFDSAKDYYSFVFFNN